MNPLTLLAVPALAVAAVVLFTQGFRLWIERRHPRAGRMVDVGGYHLHVAERGVPDGRPPLLFLHGASGNLLDQLNGPHVPPGRHAVFVDRPGHGHSERGPRANATPRGQADAVAALLNAVGIERATVVGHSYGGAVAASFALHHPERTAGLVLLSPVTHPWPGGQTLWYYDLGVRPVLGRLFAHTVFVAAGLKRTACALAGVFAPQRVPKDYARQAGVPLALRPASFLANSADLTSLYAAVAEDAPHYGRIDAPTAIVAGAADRIVWTDIHARAVARQIGGSRLVVVPSLGHKPDWTAPALVREAIAAVADRATLAAWSPTVLEMAVVNVPAETDPGIETGPDTPPATATVAAR